MDMMVRGSYYNFRAMADNSNDGIIIIAGKEGVPAYVNQKFEETTLSEAPHIMCESVWVNVVIS